MSPKLITAAHVASLREVGKRYARSRLTAAEPDRVEEAPSLAQALLVLHLEGVPTQRLSAGQRLRARAELRRGALWAAGQLVDAGEVHETRLREAQRFLHPQSDW